MNRDDEEKPILSNGEIAIRVLEAAFELWENPARADDLPPGMGREVYYALFAAVSYSVEMYGLNEITVRLDEISRFSQAVAETTGLKAWTTAESVRQSYYKLRQRGLPIVVQLRDGHGVEFDVELQPKKQDREEVVVRGRVIVNDEEVRPRRDTLTGRFMMGEMDAALRSSTFLVRYFDRAAILAGRTAISAVLVQSTVPVLRNYAYVFGTAPTTIGIDWGDGKTKYYRKDRKIAHTFTQLGVFQPRFVPTSDAPFPFRIEVVDHEPLTERFRAERKVELRLAAESEEDKQG